MVLFLQIYEGSDEGAPSSGETIQINYVTRVDFNFANAIVSYESIGQEGGIVINNGALISSVNLNTSIVTNTFDEAFLLVDKLRKITKPVIIGGTVTRGTLFGKYVIANIPGTINEGAEHITVTVNLTEYRQANVSTNLINAVYQGDAIADFIKRLNFQAP